MFNRIILTIVFASNLLFASDQNIGIVLCSETDCYAIKETLKDDYRTQVFVVENQEGKRFVMKTDPNFMKSLIGSDVEKEYITGQLLNHPNILKSVELFSSRVILNEENKYVILEFVNGRVFSSLTPKSISKAVALKGCIQLIDALIYAFDKGFIYDDFNHNNFILNANSDIVIIDLFAFVKIPHYLDPYINKALCICQENLLRNSFFISNELKELKHQFHKIEKKHKKLQKNKYPVKECLKEIKLLLESKLKYVNGNYK